MLPRAHFLVREAGGEARVEAYWRIGRGRFDGLQDAPYEALVDRLAGLLEESVRLQMISDVPLGAFLSGGVDSSIVTAIMARTSGSQIKTFSVGFEAEGETIDESADALATACFLGTDHHAVLVRGADVRDRLEHVIAGLDQPSVDGVNSYFVSWAARQGGLTVAVSGTGGDELFAGYPWFIDMAAYGNAPHSPFQTVLAQALRQPALDLLLRGKPGRLVHKVHSQGDFVSRYAELYQIFGAAGARQLIRPGLRAAAQAGRAPYFDLRHLDEVPEGTPVERVSALCLRGYTGNQLLRDIDAVSMAHSLEVRVPYLDPNLLDFAMSLPDSAKLGDVRRLSGPSHTVTYRESGAKRILIDVGMRYLPPGYDQQPKRGFAMPFMSWLKGPLQPMLMDTLSEKRRRERGLLEVAAGLAVRDEFLAGRLHWTRPWLLMVLELWCQQVLDRCGRLGSQEPAIEVSHAFPSF
jgi:asparagine synthase (glutamine-hydrolysing)